MSSLLRIVALVIAMAIALAVFTEYVGDSGDAKTAVLGLPVVSVRQSGAQGWIALGQTGVGVLVVAQAGAGLVAFVQVGAGAVFGIGQGMISLVMLGQIGVGLVTFVGQAGLGAQAIGQGVARRRSREYFAELNGEMTRLLSWRGR